MTVADRFWSKVYKDGPVPSHRPELGPCWTWTAYRVPQGYGRVQFGGRVRQAHVGGPRTQAGAMAPESR